jgi:hypothetical protein
MGRPALFLTNVLAIIVVGVVVFSLVQLIRGGRPRPALGTAFGTVLAMSLIVVAALGVTTYRTISQANEIAAATDIGERWAEGNGEELISVSYKGDDLVFLIQGSSDGSGDLQLSRLLGEELPDGTPVVINRIPGERLRLPDIGT